jgi:hypothetical protein
MSKSRSRITGALWRLNVPALAFLGCVATAFGQGTLVGKSPFMPSGGAGGAGAAPSEDYELAGSSVQGSDVSVCIFERQAKRSEWIPVGGISDGIHVISFDVTHDKAVVSISGAIKELGMRKATVASAAAAMAPRAMAVSSGPVAAPTPIASAPMPAASAVTEQREARMLVSDLLEIGVQQRKAYQDAKQKAASEPPAQPTN